MNDRKGPGITTISTFADGDLPVAAAFAPLDEEVVWKGSPVYPNEQTHRLNGIARKAANERKVGFITGYLFRTFKTCGLPYQTYEIPVSQKQSF
jgi:hypothetical protein